MRRQAVVSMPLSFLIVIIAAIAFTSTQRDTPVSGLTTLPDQEGTVEAEIGSDISQNPPKTVHLTSEVVEITPRPRSETPMVVVSEPGESLADVAVRVYGTVEMVEPMWTANSRVVDSNWRPLPTGTVLRLP